MNQDMLIRFNQKLEEEGFLCERLGDFISYARKSLAEDIECKINYGLMKQFSVVLFPRIDPSRRNGISFSLKDEKEVSKFISNMSRFLNIMSRIYRLTELASFRSLGDTEKSSAVTSIFRSVKIEDSIFFSLSYAYCLMTEDNATFVFEKHFHILYDLDMLELTERVNVDYLFRNPA